MAYARKKRAHVASTPLPRAVLGKAAAALAIGAGAFYLGIRAGTPKLAAISEGAADAHLTTVEHYHAISLHTRKGVVLRAPSVAWELPAARYIDRSGLPRVELPRQDIARGTERPIAEALSATAALRGTRFNREDLSVLLWATAGITDRRGGYDLRTSASSGALFPTEIYALVFDVEGLAPGTYAYAPDTHALFDLGTPPRAEPAFGLDPDAPPTLSLVVTSVFRRTGHKYRDRAYRYVVADAGHAIGNAVVAAAELGLMTQLVDRFDDAAVARSIGVDNRSEGVVQVLAMSPGRRGALAPKDSLFEPAALVDPEELELGATALAHLATSMTFLDPGLPAGGRIDLPSSERCAGPRPFADRLAPQREDLPQRSARFGARCSAAFFNADIALKSIAPAIRLARCILLTPAAAVAPCSAGAAGPARCSRLRRVAVFHAALKAIMKVGLALDGRVVNGEAGGEESHPIVG